MESALSGKVDLPSLESFLLNHLPKSDVQGPEPLAKLEESMAYTIKSGGKRFRPALSLLTAKTLGAPESKVYGVAAAVEWVHSYSLIHDDLPCMDNDDERRGKPTNHKVYGEGMALLAGDALLTDAFSLLANCYADEPEKAVMIIQEFAYSCGHNGMVGGQSVDIDPSEQEKADWISYIHEKKTGALIQASVVCAALACGASEDQIVALKAFSGQLGVAFQLADDLLDWDPENPEPTSFINVVGLEETTRLLEEASVQCIDHLKKVGLTTEYYEPLITFNKERDA
ncbi:MAG: polyprenyl synthetase family protein [Bdellovibrionales bacterium]|nr:polyprenyl synthetase family protein [Bdellovibrionales bacterium]